MTRDGEVQVTDLSGILPWYTGKALERVEGLLPEIAEAERAGAWPPKLSRAARAALSKQNVAEKFARANERSYDPKRRGDVSGLLEDVTDVRGELAHESKLRGWSLVRAMMFGKFDEAPALVQLADALATYVQNDVERAALAKARRWAVDFTPLARLVAQLDATRPRPNYMFGEISAVVRANVESAMGLSFRTVSVSVSAAGADQCQACGHAIRDTGNWCPLVLDGPGGPASLWVGRDCARHLFGCKVSGEGTFSRPTDVPP